LLQRVLAAGDNHCVDNRVTTAINNAIHNATHNAHSRPKGTTHG
jgi:hypothetical protein